MTSLRPNRRDLQAVLFAAAATLVTLLLHGPEAGLSLEADFGGAAAQAGDEQAMRGLLDAEQAQAEGAWLLDDPQAEARLSFAPEHDRLVWRVDGGTAEVLLDARTGEALAFEFEFE